MKKITLILALTAITSFSCEQQVAKAKEQEVSRLTFINLAFCKLPFHDL